MIPWKLITSMSCSNEHGLLYLAEYKGKKVQLEIITPRHKSGNFGKQREAFFIVGDNREFKTQDDLIDAIEINVTPCDNCILRRRLAELEQRGKWSSGD